MATATRGDSKTRVFLEFVKVEHTLFALPFVLVGWLLGEAFIGRPPLSRGALATLALVLIAAVSARTLAMTLNRIVDRAIDARNPRTAGRALPTGAMGATTAWAIAGASLGILVASAASLNLLCLALAPLLVGLFFLYPYAKRFTVLCHGVLGLAFFCAPAGGYLAVTGSLDGLWPRVVGALAPAFWVAGFDIIYALLDIDFDRANGIRSVPARYGIERAKHIAFALHVLTAIALAAFGLLMRFAWPYWVAVLAVVVLLGYEHALARRGSPAAINKAFFNVNAGLGWVVLAGVAGALFV